MVTNRFPIWLHQDGFNNTNYKHGMSRTSIYKRYHSMLCRCYNKNYPGYSFWGGRGIKVCNRWRISFLDFLQDMGKGYSKGLTLERIDNNRDYEPSNCKWVTKDRQAKNRRSNKFLEFNGEKMCISEWAKRLGMAKMTLVHRIDRGWSVNKAFTSPIYNQ